MNIEDKIFALAIIFVGVACSLTAGFGFYEIGYNKGYEEAQNELQQTYVVSDGLESSDSFEIYVEGYESDCIDCLSDECIEKIYLEILNTADRIEFELKGEYGNPKGYIAFYWDGE